MTAKNHDGSSSANSVATAVVKAVAVTPAQSVTLSASTFKVVYGTGTTLSGTISSKQSGQRVTVLAQRYEDAKLSSLANVTTGSGGTWSYFAKPTIQTAYQAQWNKADEPLAQDRRPSAGDLPRDRGQPVLDQGRGRPLVRRKDRPAAAALVGRPVGDPQAPAPEHELDRRSSPPSSSPRGTSTVRIAFSVNQAGAGYLGGMSRTIVYHRG